MRLGEVEVSKVMLRLLDYEGSELIANSWIKIHTSKLNLESGDIQTPNTEIQIE
jgi:hypothetical protein